jgi:hypothetical protein
MDLLHSHVLLVVRATMSTWQAIYAKVVLQDRLTVLTVTLKQVEIFYVLIAVRPIIFLTILQVHVRYVMWEYLTV